MLNPHVLPYFLADEPGLPAVGKAQILAEWQRFIHSGFKQLFFSRNLYRFLQRYGGFAAHFNQATCWACYFNADIGRLAAFLDQFGGSRCSAEQGTTAWLDGPAADLKEAMCQEMTLASSVARQLLADLEQQHLALAQTWQAFALEADLAPGQLPAAYRVTENTRTLLAYAIGIALRRPNLLQTLQITFPTHWLETPARELTLTG